MEPPPEAVAFGLQDHHVGLLGLFPGFGHWGIGDVPLRGCNRPFFEVQQLGVDVDPVARFFGMRRRRILPFKKPIGICRLPGGVFRTLVVAVDRFKCTEQLLP